MLENTQSSNRLFLYGSGNELIARVAPLEVDRAPEWVRRVVGGRVSVHLSSAIRAVRVARDILHGGAVRLAQAPQARVAVLAAVLIQLVLVLRRVVLGEELVSATSNHNRNTVQIVHNH